MKISFTLGRPGPISREKAWAAFVMNLTLPGCGTLMAGRKTGYGQLAIQAAGLLISLASGGRLLVWTFQNWSRINDPYADPFEKLQEMWVVMRWPVLGLAVFALSWVWAFFSGWSILQESKRIPGPPPLTR
jgi:hypothetical protein